MENCLPDTREISSQCLVAHPVCLSKKTNQALVDLLSNFAQQKKTTAAQLALA